MEVPPLKDESGLPDDPLNHPENINVTRDTILDELKKKEKTTVDNLHNARIEYERLNYELTQIRSDIEKRQRQIQNKTKRSGGRLRTNKRCRTNKRRARK
jgi:hypothetical protein